MIQIFFDGTKWQVLWEKRNSIEMAEACIAMMLGLDR